MIEVLSKVSTYVIVGIPPCQERTKHEVVVAPFPNGRGFNISIPSEDVFCNIEIVLAQCINA